MSCVEAASKHLMSPAQMRAWSSFPLRLTLYLSMTMHKMGAAPESSGQWE